MICPNCQANLEHVNREGETLFRNRAIVLKSAGLVLVCPKCKSDVPVSPPLMNQLHQRAVLFLKR